MPDCLLMENGDRIRLEDGTGCLLLEFQIAAFIKGRVNAFVNSRNMSTFVNKRSLTTVVNKRRLNS